MSKIDNTKNVFVSHYNKDDEHIQKLKKILESKGLKLKNSSIDSTKSNNAKNPDYIKGLLRDRINWAGTFICLIGEKTHTREWVNWEIEQAAKQGKRIIGVFINGAKDSDVPDAFEEFGNALVAWTGDKIIEAIEGKNNFENSNGELRAPNSGLNRGNC